jgi:prophage DNA circulation protein
MDNVREAAFAETPVLPLSDRVINAAVIFSFVEQSKIIAAMTFRSQIDVDAVLDRMELVIEQIKVSKSDSFILSDYRNFVALAALLIQHLATTRRLLPRIVQFRFPINYPSLTMANRIYADASRAEELAAENRTIHPAFMQRHVTALSV